MEGVMRAALRPEVKRAFKDTPATQKAMRVAQGMVDGLLTGLGEQFHEEMQTARASVPNEERIAHYNAGYSRAVADLFGVEDSGGMKVFAINGRYVKPGPDGRLHLEEAP